MCGCDVSRDFALFFGSILLQVYIWEGSEKGLYYRRGYPLGTPGNKSSPTLVNNHLSFTVKIHKPEGLPGWRIVGFEVVPYSIDSARIDTDCSPDQEFDAEKYPPQTVIASPPSQATKSISWSYSLMWSEDKEVAWSSRWDHYLKSSDASAANIHWFAIMNSLMIVLCLSAMVAMILLRALHKVRVGNLCHKCRGMEEQGMAWSCKLLTDDAPVVRMARTTYHVARTIIPHQLHHHTSRARYRSYNTVPNQQLRKTPPPPPNYFCRCHDPPPMEK